MHILDVTDPGAPQLASTAPTPGEANGVAAAGDAAYVADGEGGLVIVRRLNRVYLPLALRL